MQTPFITSTLAQSIASQYETPSYIYSEDLLIQQARKVLDFPHAYWLTVRYAMKANANANILRLFNTMGIHIDASSGFEATRAIAAGIPWSHIQMSGQELPRDLTTIGEHDIQFVATSLHQLQRYGQMYPGTGVWVRLNPGVWSGAFKKIDTGGPTSSFGIWYEYIPQIIDMAARYDLDVTKLHIHIWSENTAQARSDAAADAIDIMAQFPKVTTLNLWGGFKIAIMPYEKTADLQAIWSAVKTRLEDFYASTGRKIHLEIEPGKYLVMNSCSMLTRVIDIVTTNEYTFIKVDTGMTELPRVPMYGIQQPIYICKAEEEEQGCRDTSIMHPDEVNTHDIHTWPHEATNTDTQSYVVVGHCCESGDLLTCQLYQSDVIDPIELPTAYIWDLIVVQSCGAYNSSMAMKHYNSFPEAGELMIRSDGSIVEMRKRQNVEEIWGNEVRIETIK